MLTQEYWKLGGEESPGFVLETSVCSIKQEARSIAESRDEEELGRR